MPSEIIVALCSLAGTLAGSVLGILGSHRFTMYRIEQLEKKVDLHNRLVERDLQTAFRARCAFENTAP